MHIPIDPASPQPIYEQIRAALAERITGGELPAGSALPSIRALARDLRVSVITTTRAYTELVADGLAVSVQGKGVFVRDQEPGVLRDRALSRIDEHLDAVVRTARSAGIGPAEVRGRLSRAFEEDRP